MRKIIAYLEVIRIQRIHLFLLVPFVVLGFGGIGTLTEKASEIVNLMVIFGPVLYGGIYAINGWADINEDKAHPGKKLRPIPSGRIKSPTVLIIGCIHILIGLLLTWAYYSEYFYIAIALLTTNLVYTFILKELGRVYSVLLISSTIALRVLLGFAVLGIWDISLAWMLLSIYFGGIRGHFLIQVDIKHINEGDYKYIPKVALLFSIAAGVVAFLLSNNPLTVIPAIIYLLDTVISRGKTVVLTFKRFSQDI